MACPFSNLRVRWMRLLRRRGYLWSAVVLGSVALVACKESRVITHGRLKLPRATWVQVPTGGVHVRGRSAELCMPVPSNYSFTLPMLAMRDANGQPVHVQARLIANDGSSTNFPTPSFEASRREQTLCFDDNGDVTGRTYNAIQLMSSDTITFEDVRWRTGARIGLP